MPFTSRWRRPGNGFKRARWHRRGNGDRLHSRGRQDEVDASGGKPREARERRRRRDRRRRRFDHIGDRGGPVVPWLVHEDVVEEVFHMNDDLHLEFDGPNCALIVDDEQHRHGSSGNGMEFSAQAVHWVNASRLPEYWGLYDDAGSDKSRGVRSRLCWGAPILPRRLGSCAGNVHSGPRLAFARSGSSTPLTRLSRSTGTARRTSRSTKSQLRSQRMMSSPASSWISASSGIRPHDVLETHRTHACIRQLRRWTT